MDIFELQAWIRDNRRKILIASHVIFAVSIVNTAYALIIASSDLQRNGFIWSMILQATIFICVQLTFSKGEPE